MRLFKMLLVLAFAVSAFGDAYHDTYDGASVLQGYLSYATGTITATAAMALSSTLAVTGDATFAEDVTLGNAAGDAITITGTPTIATLLTLTTGLANNGETVLGNAATDTVDVTGVLNALDDMTVTGGVVMSDTLDVVGAFTAASVAADNGVDSVYTVVATDIITIVGGVITDISAAE